MMIDELDDNVNAEEGAETSLNGSETPDGAPGAGQAGTFSVSGM